LTKVSILAWLDGSGAVRSRWNGTACVGGGKAVGGLGDCWVEFRANLKKPSGFFKRKKSASEILECKSYAQFALTLVARRLANQSGLMALVARDTVGVIGKV
jgi:hypothetical protein